MTHFSHQLWGSNWDTFTSYSESWYWFEIWLSGILTETICSSRDFFYCSSYSNYKGRFLNDFAFSAIWRTHCFRSTSYVVRRSRDTVQNYRASLLQPSETNAQTLDKRNQIPSSVVVFFRGSVAFVGNLTCNLCERVRCFFGFRKFFIRVVLKQRKSVWALSVSEFRQLP